MGEVVEEVVVVLQSEVAAEVASYPDHCVAVSTVQHEWRLLQIIWLLKVQDILNSVHQLR
jgi:hypothetical protein